MHLYIFLLQSAIEYFIFSIHRALVFGMSSPMSQLAHLWVLEHLQWMKLDVHPYGLLITMLFTQMEG